MVPKLVNLTKLFKPLQQYIEQGQKSPEQRASSASNMLPVAAFDVFIQRLKNNPVAPHFIAILVTATSMLADQKAATWWQFSLILLQISVELSPILLMKWLSTKYVGLTQKLLWLGAFVLMPALLLLLINNPQSHSFTLLTEDFTFILIWLIEGALIAEHWNTLKQKSIWLKKLTLDKIILVIMLVVSFFMALVLNSYDDPIANQPIKVNVDLIRNLTQLPMLFYYWLQMFLLYSVLYLVYWLNHHYFIKRILSTHGVFTFLWMVTLFLLIAAPIFTQLVLWFPLNQGVEHPLTGSGDHNPFSMWNIHLGILVLVITTPIINAFLLQKNHRQVAELEKEKLHTELKWLQQQINPHFLFNTLNNLYALTLTRSERAPEVILQLADLLRFVVYKGSQAQVTLAEDIAYLKNYLALQQIRVENKCRLKVDFHLEQPESVTISPLLLVMFIENAFKHGIEPSDEPSWLTVSCKQQGRKLYFRCENSLVGSQKEQNRSFCRDTDHEENSGLGLKNVKRRLDLVYQQNYQLNVCQNDQNNSYIVELSLDLTERA